MVILPTMEFTTTYSFRTLISCLLLLSNLLNTMFSHTNVECASHCLLCFRCDSDSLIIRFGFKIIKQYEWNAWIAKACQINKWIGDNLFNGFHGGKLSVPTVLLPHSEFRLTNVFIRCTSHKLWKFYVSQPGCGHWDWIWFFSSNLSHEYFCPFLQYFEMKKRKKKRNHRIWFYQWKVLNLHICVFIYDINVKIFSNWESQYRW